MNASSAEELHRLARLVVDRVVAHFATLPDQPLGRYASRADLEVLLREPPPEAGRDLAEVLSRFDEQIAPFACRINHPRFLAFIPSAPSFPSILGDWLTAGFNFFAGVWYEAAGPAMVELVVLDWFRDFLGMPAGTSGLLTGGGSEANLTALVVARERLQVADRSRAVLYTGTARHWSIDRAARIIGLAPEQVRLVGCDGHLRLDPARLRQQVVRDREAGLLPWVVVANAGATNTGAVDPLEEVAALGDEEDLWLHVDAAYGWPAVLVDEGRRLLAGIGRADSVTLDPHKWLAQTFEVGGLLVRDGDLLRQAFAIRPEYMEDVEPASDEVNFADHGLALTRRFRALKVWLSLQVLGVSWFRRLVEQGMQLARHAEERLRQAGFEILSGAQLSIVCFRHVPAGMDRENDAVRIDEHNRRLLDQVRISQEAFLSSTRLSGCVALRTCFVNWRTTIEDVDRVVTLLADVATRIA